MVKSIKSSAAGADRLEQILSKLKEKYFRLTPQRLAVLKILAGSGEFAPNPKGGRL